MQQVLYCGGLCDVLWVLCLCVWFLVLFRCWLADYIRGCNCIAWCHSISEENATDCLAWNRVELAIRKTRFSQAMQTLGIDKFFRKKKIVVFMNESCRYFRCVFQGFGGRFPILKKYNIFSIRIILGIYHFSFKEKYDLLRHRYPSNTSSSRDMESKIGRLEGGTLTCRNRNQHLHIVRKS